MVTLDALGGLGAKQGLKHRLKAALQVPSRPGTMSTVAKLAGDLEGVPISACMHSICGQPSRQWAMMSWTTLACMLTFSRFVHAVCLLSAHTSMPQALGAIAGHVSIMEIGLGREKHPDPANPRHSWHWHVCIHLSARIDIPAASRLHPIGRSGAQPSPGLG